MEALCSVHRCELGGPLKEFPGDALNFYQQVQIKQMRVILPRSTCSQLTVDQDTAWLNCSRRRSCPGAHAHQLLQLLQGLPFSIAGVGDLLALFRCVSCRYRFSTDMTKPALMGAIGRVYTTCEVSPSPIRLLVFVDDAINYFCVYQCWLQLRGS